MHSIPGLKGLVVKLNTQGKWYMEVKLEALSGSLPHEVYRIDEQHSLTLGRATECTITVAGDESLAPFYFQIKVEPPLVWLVSSRTFAS